MHIHTYDDTRPNNADDLKATIKATWSSITPQQCHRSIGPMSCHTEAVIHAKGGLMKCWVLGSKPICQKPDICFKYSFLLILLDSNLGFSLSVRHNNRNKTKAWIISLCTESIKYKFCFLKWLTKIFFFFRCTCKVYTWLMAVCQ